MGSFGLSSSSSIYAFAGIVRDLIFLYQGHLGFGPKPNEAPINNPRRRFRYRLSTNPTLQGSAVYLQNLRRLRDRIFLHIHCAAGAAFVKRKVRIRVGPDRQESILFIFENEQPWDSGAGRLPESGFGKG
jgi:hypothetical protein